MTKAEKEKERKRQACLEAMGLDPNAPVVAAAPAKVTYTKKKPAKAAAPAKPATPTEEVKPDTPAEPIPAADDDVLDDWESSDFAVADVAAKITELAVNVVVPSEKEAEEAVDILQKEKELEQERLKKLGIERLKREEEARIKRYATRCGLVVTANCSCMLVVLC